MIKLYEAAGVNQLKKQNNYNIDKGTKFPYDVIPKKIINVPLCKQHNQFVYNH